ncbi:hypothetical protein LCGC14_1972740, partial [marine sediment metagenome]
MTSGNIDVEQPARMTDLSELTPESLRALSAEDLARVTGDLLEKRAEIRKESQLLYYQPASDLARQVHLSKAHTIGIGGGNRSSKTETALVEAIACATGVFPLDFQAEFREKFKGPLNVRVCIESLTTVLHPIMLPKLMWWRWTGIDQPGGLRGHYGWVPRMCLKQGSWDKSWSEKLRTLTFFCRDPDDPDRILGESQIQFLSYDQDPTDYASGTFDIVIHDEPPPFSIWRENQARVLDVAGRIFLSMTWPDDAAIPVDWIYDEVYELGQPGSTKDPGIDWFELQTLDNVHIDAKAILDKTKNWTEETKKVRLKGQPLRFSNRIHPLFTDFPQMWCFTCGKDCMPAEGVCGCERKSTEIVEYQHIEEFDIGQSWPVVFLLDPHPRKPHMCMWVAVDPSDDYWVVQEGSIEGDAADLKTYVDAIEEGMEFDVRLRLMDPNMGLSPSSQAKAAGNRTVQQEFDKAGLRCGLADDNRETARSILKEMMKPEQRVGAPSFHVFSSCRKTNHQYLRYSWDEWTRYSSEKKDPKPKPREKEDDFPTLGGYMANAKFTHDRLKHGGQILRRRELTDSGRFPEITRPRGRSDNLPEHPWDT